MRVFVECVTREPKLALGLELGVALGPELGAAVGCALRLPLDRLPLNLLTGHERNGGPYAAGQTGLQEMLTISEKIDGCDAKPSPLMPTHIRLFTRRLFDVL
jgi:hypothetical protein